jgi:hypothetical protein
MPTYDYPYKNLVFEGGGVKGVSYGGVFEVLEQRQITSQIEPTLIGGGNFRRRHYCHHDGPQLLCRGIPKDHDDPELRKV